MFEKGKYSKAEEILNSVFTYTKLAHTPIASVRRLVVELFVVLLF